LGQAESTDLEPIPVQPADPFEESRGDLAPLGHRQPKATRGEGDIQTSVDRGLRAGGFKTDTAMATVAERLIG
jgi:hypothetical protein